MSWRASQQAAGVSSLTYHKYTADHILTFLLRPIERFLAPVMEESEEDTLIPESPSPSIASLLPPAEFQAHSKIPTAKAKKISRPTAEEDSDGKRG